MDPLVRSYLGDLNPPQSIEDTRKIIQYIIDQYRLNGMGRLAVVEKSSGDFIGWAGLKIERNINGHDQFYDLGYRFMSKYWNKGYASEAASAVVSYGFHILQVDKICAYIQQGNSSSRRVAEKSGLQLTSTFRGECADEWWLEIERTAYAPEGDSDVVFVPDEGRSSEVLLSEQL